MKMTMNKYYVVEENYEGCLDQLSIALDSHEEAVKFKDSDYNKKTHSRAYILCSLKQVKDCTTCIYGADDYGITCRECDDNFSNCKLDKDI